MQASQTAISRCSNELNLLTVMEIKRLYLLSYIKDVTYKGKGVQVHFASDAQLELTPAMNLEFYEIPKHAMKQEIF